MKRMVVAGLLMILSACGAAPDPAPEPTARPSVLVDDGSGNHCLGQFVPYLDGLAQQVLLNLPKGETFFRNDQTFTRGGDKGQREAVMQFTLQPNGTRGSAVGVIDPKTCQLGKITLTFEK